MNLEHFVVSLYLAKRKLSLHPSKIRRNFTLIKKEHMENIDKMKKKKSIEKPHKIKNKN